MSVENRQYLLYGNNIHKEFVIERWPLIGKPRKQFTALEQVTFFIDAAETVGIVGESGSGKSTLGEILGGLRLCSGGSVYYNGKNIREMDSAQFQVFRRNVQFIFQDPKGSMHPYFRIREIIGEPLKTLKLGHSHEKIKRLVEEMIAQVGLDRDTADKYPGQLSGGQCQRVAIARALVVNPQIIICDEAVSALDVSVQAQILNLLKDLQKQHRIAYIFISHDIGVVNYMADRIVVMNRGRIVETGTAAQVFMAPVDPYTQKLVASSFAS